RRAAILRALQAYPEFQPLWRYVQWLLRNPSHLFLQDRGGAIRATFLAGEGVRQGDVLGPLLFALGTIDAYRAVQVAYPNITFTSIMDDVSIVGLPEDAMAATTRLQEELAPLGLSFNARKTVLLWPHH